VDTRTTDEIYIMVMILYIMYKARPGSTALGGLYVVSKHSAADEHKSDPLPPQALEVICHTSIRARK
jgi:hypothetical protein